MSPTLLLTAPLLFAFAPPPDPPPPNEAAWEKRHDPEVSVTPEEGFEMYRHGSMGVIVEIRPPITGQIEVRLDRLTKGGGAVRIIGVRLETQRITRPEGPLCSAIVNFDPPGGGWPPGPALLTAEPDHAPHLRVVRQITFLPEDDAPVAPEPEFPPADSGVTLDANVAALTPAVSAATVQPGERFRVRGVFTREAPPDPARSGAVMHLAVQDARGVHFSGGFAATLRDEPADGEATGEPTFWFVAELTAPPRPGEYTLEMRLTSDYSRDGGPKPERFPRLTFTVAEAETVTTIGGP